MRDKLIVWIALGFGAGNLPKAPGTYGSILGLIWFWLLSLISNLYLAALLIGVSVLFGVWICGEAERILKCHDPGCIVIDEIVAVPIAGLGWVAWELSRDDSLGFVMEADLTTFFWLGLVFVLFRFSDIAKPWPVGLSQSLPRGWGVMTDDLLAGIYVAVLMFLGRLGISSF